MLHNKNKLPIYSMIKKLLSNTNLIILILLVLISVWAGKGLFKYSVFSTHDGNHHIARSFDAVATIREGHFPLRWAGSLNYQCGVPVYNFFYPLIYYLLIIVDFFFNNIILSLKIIYLLSLVFASLFFYLWMSEETNNKIAAIGGALLYLFAPYRFSLIFVRGSPEFIAYALLPLVLYWYSKAFKEKNFKKKIIHLFFASFFGGLLTISHNFAAMFIMPLILVYILSKFYLQKNVKTKEILFTLFSYVGSFGLGSFFIGPALIEKKFTRIGKIDILNYKDHFPTLKQLIRSRWDYFYSSPGVENDGMSFMLGYAQWFVLGISILFLFSFVIKKRKSFSTKDLYKNYWIILLIIVSVLSIFLMLPYSIFLWEALPLLQEIQFPWRILGISVFTLCSLFSFLLVKIKNKNIFYFVLIVGVFLAIYGNRNHMLPQPISSEDIHLYDDFEKLHYHRHSTTTLGDDITYPDSRACSFDTPLVHSQLPEAVSANVINIGNTHGKITISVNKLLLGDDSKLTFRLAYFPNAYKFYINSNEVKNYANCDGKVCLEAREFVDGRNILEWQIVQTPIQNFFNFISITFLLVFILLVFKFSFPGKISNKSLLTILVLLVVFVLFSLFRFHELDKRTVFNWDQERDANAVLEIINTRSPTLLGPRVLGPEGFFLPPYFFYLILPFYVASSMSPYAIISFMIFYGIFFFLSSFFVIKKIFNSLVAVLFLLFWAILPLTISIDTISWNPLLIPLAQLVLIYFLYLRNLIAKTHILDLLIGIIIGLGMSFHIQFLLFVPIIFPYFYSELRKDGKKTLKSAVVILVGFLITLFPLVIFDLRHDFLNTKLLINFLLSKGELDLFAFAPVWENFVSSFTGIRLPGGIVFIVFSFLFLLAVKFTKDKFKRNFWFGLFLVWTISPFLFAIYGSRPSEYYFNYLIFPVLLLISYLISFLRLKPKLYQITGVISLLLLIVAVTRQSNELLSENKQSLYYKYKAIEFIKTSVSENKFNISFSVPIGEDAGYRYIIKHLDISQSGNSEDPLVRIVIPPESEENVYPIGGIGVYYPTSFFDD